MWWVLIKIFPIKILINIIFYAGLEYDTWYSVRKWTAETEKRQSVVVHNRHLWNSSYTNGSVAKEVLSCVQECYRITKKKKTLKAVYSQINHVIQTLCGLIL
jgi:hypothetical protein